MKGIECDFCGYPFRKPERRLEKDKHHFCCRECRDRFFGNGYTSEENELRILAYIGVDCVTAKELSEQLDIPISSVYNYLKQLKEDDYICRTDDAKYKLSGGD